MNRRFAPGEILMANMFFTDGTGTKRRPVVVLRDIGDDDLLVAPVTSQVARVVYDVVISEWQQAGLRLPSTIRSEKLATIRKSNVTAAMGQLAASDWSQLARSIRLIADEILKS